MVAAFEAVKGMLVLLAGFGLLELIHHDFQRTAEELVGHLHLNPAKHLPRVFIDAASRLTDARLWMLASLAGVYASMRLLEAYGLWRNQKWAEWLAVGSGAIYVPFEIHGLLLGFDWLKLCLLTVNGIIIVVIVRAVRRRRRSERESG